MKKQLIICFFTPFFISAQTRFQNPVFSSVKVTENVVYGINATILYQALPPNGVGEAIPEELVMDVYEPDGDTMQKRPLVIILHSGRFLPLSINGICSGSRKDFAIVQLSERLAKMGFVVAAADYRLGWNPIATTQTERAFSLARAIYRGVQDSRTCARFFRKDNASTNQFRIDPDKFVLWGLGTGAYISLASATLDTITDTYIPKLVSPAGPFLYEPYLGNPDGTSVGIMHYSTSFDTLCYPNHVGYSSEFALQVNMGGVLIDTSWIDSEDIPLMSISSTYENHLFTEPCGVDLLGLIAPIPLYIFEVAGSCAVQKRQHFLGIDLPWLNASLDDDLSAHARAINGQVEGFYPFEGVKITEPWAYSDSLGVNYFYCNPDSLNAVAYLDTTLHYFAPRACITLGLSLDCSALSASHTFPEKMEGTIYPNPCHASFVLKGFEEAGKMEVFDQMGRNQVSMTIPVSATLKEIDCHTWPPGMYFVRLHTGKGIRSLKLIKE